MGTLVFQATLGGQVNLTGPNTASTFTISVPAVTGNMITSGDTGTVTNTMLAGSIANAKLLNSSVTIGSTAISLGATSTTLDGVNIGATTPGTGAFTTLSASSNVTLSGGTANGVAYLNGSKVLTTGSALTFDGTNFGGSVNVLVSDNKAIGFGSNAYFLGNSASGFIAGYINGSEQMRLTSGGLVVGSTTVPTVGSTAMLAVGNVNGGTQAITQSGSIVYRTSASTSGVDFYNPNSSPLQWYTAGTSRMVLDASGNFVVGGTTALLNNAGRGNITLNGATDAILAFGNGGTNSAYIFSNAGNFELNAIGARTMNFTVNGSERARIDSSGNLLVGTTSADPISAQVNGLSIRGAVGDILASAGDTPVLQIARRGSDGGVIQFYKNTTAVGSVSTTSVLTTYNTTSDYRLKTVLGPVSDAGSRIDALEPVEYEWKSEGSRTRGFLAHKFQEVYPQSVSGEKDAVDADGNPKYQSMQAATSEVIADLVAEIQSLRKRLADAGIA